MIKSISILFIFLLVVVSFRFFDARFINESFTNYSVYLFSICTIALSVQYLFPPRIGFVLPVQLILFSIMISIVMAKLSWDQSIKDGIVASIPLMLWILFFYLLSKSVPIRIIETIIIIYGITYIFLFLFQFLNSTSVLFGSQKEFLEERGITRIAIGGGGAFYLSVYLGLNRLTTQRHGRFIWILLTLFGILIPFLQATRQLIGAVLIIYLLHFIKDQTIFKKVLFVFSFIGLFTVLKDADIKVIKGIKEAQEKTLEEGKDYIRIQSGIYFIKDFSPNIINRFLGNGVPYEGISEYGKFVENLKMEGFYLSDIGLVSMYIMFGPLAIIGYVLIWIKSFTLPLPKDYYYLKYYLWFLLITCFTSAAVYSPRYLIVTVFVLYIYQSLFVKQVMKFCSYEE